MSDFKPGEWVQVWAQIDGPGNSEKNTYVRIHAETDREITGAWARNDAIVRPADGATPPWIDEEKEKSEAISNITATLRREGGMDYDAAHSVAASLFRAGVRVEGTER